MADEFSNYLQKMGYNMNLPYFCQQIQQHPWYGAVQGRERKCGKLDLSV